jgi:hypothetical protein
MKAQCSTDLYLGFGGIQNDGGSAISVDAAGNAYMAGTFVDAIQFGNIQLSTADSVATFLAKISPAGNVLWAKKLNEGFTTSYNLTVKIAASGLVIVGGTCDNFLSDFDTLPQPFVNGDVYVSAFYPTTGALEMFASCGNHGYSWMTSLTTDSSNTIYITGGFVGPIHCGSTNLNCTGAVNTFVAKYDIAGVNAWARRVTNNVNSGNRGDNIDVDGAGHLYISGWYGIACDFGGGHTLSSANYSNGYLARYDTSGNCLWAKTSIPGKIYFHQAVADTSSIFVIQESPSTMIKYNQLGDTLWTKVISNNNYNLFRKLHFQNHFMYGLSSFYNSIYLGGQTYTGSGNTLFIAKFDTTGSIVSMRKIASSNVASPAAVSFDSLQNCYLTGMYYAPDTMNQTVAMPAYGMSEVLYIKLCNATVSVPENKLNDQFSIYPNPFSEILNIDGTSEGGSIIVFDLMGKVVLSCATKNRMTQINARELQSGIYSLQFSNGKKTIVKKLIKL